MPASRGMSGDNRNRTRDLFGANEALYLLSYVPMSVTPRRSGCDPDRQGA